MDEQELNVAEQEVEATPEVETPVATPEEATPVVQPEEQAQ